MARIFLDYASITPLDKKVEKVMTLAQNKFWANPSSLHKEGEEAKIALEDARKKISSILRCKSSEIIFTSGGTESLNLAILGVIKTWQKSEVSNLPHIIVSAIEHQSIINPIMELSGRGEVEFSFVFPDEKGFINPESVKNEIKENTILVVIQHANNEIGTIQPIQKIAKVIKEWKEKNSFHYPYFLTDVSQSVLFEDISPERLGAHMIVLDGIKMYGPRGAGILFVRQGIKISPIFGGGGQERGLRSGTENTANAIGLAKALEISIGMREKESKKLMQIRDYAINKILKEFPESSLNGSLENRLPNNINICFPEQDSEFLVIKMDILGFAVSAASACHNLSLENASYVIKALGKELCSGSSLRFTLGRETKKTDLDKLIFALKKIIKKN